MSLNLNRRTLIQSAGVGALLGAIGQQALAQAQPEAEHPAHLHARERARDEGEPRACSAPPQRRQSARRASNVMARCSAAELVIGRDHDHAARRHACGPHAAGVLDRAGLRVPLDHVQVLDDHAALGRPRLDHPALLAAVLARDDQHVVVLPDGCR